MSKPYMRWFWGDWFANTKDLTHFEKGVYMDLIGHYWERGSLPDDDLRLAQIVGLSLTKFRKISSVLSQFFDPGWKHKKIEKELSRYRERSMKARQAALQMHQQMQLRSHMQSHMHSQPNARTRLQGQFNNPSLESEKEPRTRVANHVPKEEKKAVAEQASEASKPNPTTQEPDMPHNKIPISNELAASITKPRPPANEDAILREWHAAGLEPRRLANGQLMSLSLWRALQDAQQKPTETGSR